MVYTQAPSPTGLGSNAGASTEKLSDLGQGGFIPKIQFPALQDGNNHAFLPGW